MPAKSQAAGNENSSNKQRYLERKEYDRKLRKLKKRLEDSENKIEKIEKELSVLETLLGSSVQSADETHEIYERYQKLELKHNEEMIRWEQYTNDVEVFIQKGD
jgi:ATP-binding cassette subfamily F protein 3